MEAQGRVSGTDDGMISALRCVEALGQTEDFETRLALWKAAKRYAARDRLERAGGEIKTGSLRHARGMLVGARES